MELSWSNFTIYFLQFYFGEKKMEFHVRDVLSQCIIKEMFEILNPGLKRQGVYYRK